MDNNPPTIIPLAAEAIGNAEDYRKKIDILRRSEIFLGLPNEALEEIINEVTCAIKTFQVNEMVFDVGDLAPELFVVKEGKVDLILSHSAPDMQSQLRATIDTVCKGGTFGWSALIAPYTYTLSARCVEATKLLALNGAELVRFLDRETTIGYEVMKALNHIIGFRLRDSNRALFNIIAGGLKV